jgi:hypothetical protein
MKTEERWGKGIKKIKKNRVGSNSLAVFDSLVN